MLSTSRLVYAFSRANGHVSTVLAKSAQSNSGATSIHDKSVLGLPGLALGAAALLEPSLKIPGIRVGIISFHPQALAPENYSCCGKTVSRASVIFPMNDKTGAVDAITGPRSRLTPVALGL